MTRRQIKSCCPNAFRNVALLCLGACFLPLPVRVARGQNDPAGDSNKVLRTFESTVDPNHSVVGIRVMAVSSDGKYLATSGEPANPKESRHVAIWETSTGKLLHSLETHDARVRSMAFSRDGKILATCTPDHSRGTQLWEVTTGKLLRSFAGGRGVVQFDPASGGVAVVDRFRDKEGIRDGLRIHDINTGNEVRRFLIDVLQEVAFSQDLEQMLIVRTQRDTNLRLMDVKSGKQIAKLSGCDTQPTVLAFSPDGRTVAANNSNLSRSRHEVILWELTSEKEVYRLKGHTGRVLAIQFSPDGRHVATASADNTVKVWEVATGKELQTLTGHERVVTSLAFVREADQLASGSLDQKSLLWDLTHIRKTTLPTGPLTQEDLDNLWHELATSSPASAYRSLGRIVLRDEDALPYLFTRVKGIITPEENVRIRKLLAELDHPDSSVRNIATRELRKIREIARPVLLKAFSTATVEAKYRIRRILSGTENTPRFNAGDIRRMKRIVHASAVVGGDDAEKLLDLIIRDFPPGEVVDQAKSALTQLQRG